jgi:hypothetical protein
MTSPTVASEGACEGGPARVGDQTDTGASNPKRPPRVPPTMAAFSSAGTPTNSFYKSWRLPRNVPSAWG